MKITACKIRLLILLSIGIVCCGSRRGFGQDHLQLHVALAGMFQNSTDLDNFTATYNAVNREHLVRELDGMTTLVGWRWGAGYRHLDRFNYALTVGMYEVGAEDQGRFSNGERRDFALDVSSAFLDLDAGYFNGDFLFNGVLTFYFNRQVRLETGYVSFDPENRPLDGIYRGEVSFAMDLGIMAGMLKYPFLITEKLTYPVYTSHGNALSNGSAEFPSDYFAFVSKGTYPGLSSNIDGLKIFITLGYLFRF